MASYDSPGFTDMTPAGPVNQHTGAPGSGPTVYPSADSIPDSLAAGTVGSTAVVTPFSGSLVNADVVHVGAADTLSGPQADQYSGSDPDGFLGLTGDQAGHSGAGTGHVSSPGNPNAIPVGDLASQVSAARVHS